MASIAMENEIVRVEPPNWWVGFKNTDFQLMVKATNIAKSVPEISKKGISIKKTTEGSSPNYLFIDLNISDKVGPCFFIIEFKFKDGDLKTHRYELKERVKPGEEYIGFNSSDVIYLITPDRFANSEAIKNTVSHLIDNSIDRNNDYARHGGDIKGITKHLDYIDDMGFTTIWPTPVLLNDMEQESYHGYAITDFYQVDPRFGTLSDYKELVDKAKERNIKVIMDQVVHHCGLNHWWMLDLPFRDWINYQENFEKQKPIILTNHRRTCNQDPYASEKDKKEMTEGWFVYAMPDLNQRNPFMAKYLIQNSIWWIETLGLGGIRQDTYSYSDKNFMAQWAGAIMTEFPNFSIVGEEWSYNPLLIAYWQNGDQNRDGYKSNLKSTMDFSMQNIIIEALKEEEHWGTGLIKIYEGLANDFAYASPKDLMAFLDNHDMDRVFTLLNKNIVDTQMALGYLLLLPRIPQLYYGTEILMHNSEKPGDHGLIRSDFPGGWNRDPVNAFTGKNLTQAQKDMQSFLKQLLNYRKNSKAIHEGKTIHFAPFNGVYVLFRSFEDEIVAIIINKNKNPYTLNLTSFSEIGLTGKIMKNIISHTTLIWKDSIRLSSKGATILTTKL
ncbi:glycoside hydrolase family 13 protein [Arenibacter certesii]|uniref:Neopullulanase SusA n=1 Tax=Arenibacter certesii TaxID=228955 RepID=A0A918IQ46_9FLAO|nr:glycoside hydrolase family 13 protein [Arenibacter certesii]GGW26428.1 neopullulanase SusA [Arenibacter certesii]